jgi:hypothetical protein
MVSREDYRNMVQREIDGRGMYGSALIGGAKLPPRIYRKAEEKEMKAKDVASLRRKEDTEARYQAGDAATKKKIDVGRRAAAKVKAKTEQEKEAIKDRAKATRAANSDIVYGQLKSWYDQQHPEPSKFEISSKRRELAHQVSLDNQKAKRGALSEAANEAIERNPELKQQLNAAKEARSRADTEIRRIINAALGR